MDFPPCPFDSYQQGFQQSTPSYLGQPMFIDFENEFTNEYNFTNQDGLAPSTSPWSQASMQRFLNDPQRASLCNSVPQQLLPSNTHPVESIPPVASHHRQDSPYSSQELSSCSSAQSPGADAELFTDNMPSTPPSMAIFSPFQVPFFDQCEPPSPFFLSGLGGLPVENHSCVEMTEVNAIDGDTPEWKTSTPADDFNSPQSSYTFESQASVCHHIDAISRQPSVENEYKHAPSPALSAVVKDEIIHSEHVLYPKNMSRSYPTPSVRDSEGSDLEIDVASPATEDNEEDDDEYRPDNKKRGLPSVRRPAKNKRDASKDLEKGPAKRPKTSSSSTTQSAKPLPPSPSGCKGPFLCTDCSHSFKDEMTLQSHIKKQHTRPFICVFRFAGCGSTFASKNEWKRHVMSQHLVLHYWLCDIDVCAHNKNSLTNAKRSRRNKARRAAEQTLSLEPIGPPLPDGAIFNRKDLYTQHIRRMHTPVRVQRAAKTSKKNSPSSLAAAATDTEWDEEVRSLQTSALRERCQLPVYMKCPAPQCTQAFSGADAWDQRMEHVARHLERAALGQEPPVGFGGPADPSLMDWVTRADVCVVRAMGPGRWVLNNPLRAASEGRGVGRKREVALPSPVSFSTTTAPSLAGSSTAVSFPVDPSPSVKSVVFVEEEEEEDEDAEGEEE